MAKDHAGSFFTIASGAAIAGAVLVYFGCHSKKPADSDTATLNQSIDQIKAAEEKNTMQGVVVECRADQSNISPFLMIEWKKNNFLQVKCADASHHPHAYDLYHYKAYLENPLHPSLDLKPFAHCEETDAIKIKCGKGSLKTENYGPGDSHTPLSSVSNNFDAFSSTMIGSHALSQPNPFLIRIETPSTKRHLYQTRAWCENADPQTAPLQVECHEPWMQKPAADTSAARFIK